ncbi:glutathione peroxidase [Palleronia caenipelagi]|uniref:Glutathione peroxidase n=1 Tax=Palleronia caenipelagi TaxID=2489174 RepID=A0A547PNE1_9RHOB|nr:glutathione peroxidase [Palleronia caenipelagi]TRD15673.1 glutathione peroxidase [Palleronia caenipelagi]
MTIDLDTPFPRLGGGEIRLSDWRGQPVLVVNTASRCGFAFQFDGLQKLYDTYREDGLVVLAVSSDDFRQELYDEGAIRERCEVRFGLTFPMAGVTHVKGPEAHPFYASVRAETRFTPAWNFNKILIAPDGTVAGTWGATTSPTSRRLTKTIEGLL